MAAVLPFPFKQGTVPTAAAAAILTSGAAQNIIIKKAVFTNVTAGALTVTVWLVAPAGATATGNIRYVRRVIKPRTTTRRSWARLATL